ncbi:ROK family protein [Bdellovibrionales bacterium]|nr:ROK family protein [Bdellovibrionales bacterium]
MAHQYYIGLDIGGTKVEALLTEILTQPTEEALPIALPHSPPQYLKIIKRERVLTDRHLGYQAVINKIGGLIGSVLHSHSLTVSEIQAIGVGLPGTVDPKTQRMLNGNSQIFINQNFAQDLQSELNTPLPIYINNDANCFALAEVIAGCGVDYMKEFSVPPDEQIAIGVILGTGTGGGAVLRGELFSGQGGGALEIGHTVLVSGGHSCYCGRRGCAEQYLSGSGLTLAHPEKLDAPSIFKKAESGETLCIQIIETYRSLLAEFIVNLSNSFDPHFVVLGGGLSNQQLIYAGLEERVAESTFLPNSAPKIYQNRLGDSAGVFGSIFWAHSHMFRLL